MHDIRLCSIMLYDIILYDMILYYMIAHYVILYYIVVHYTILHCMCWAAPNIKMNKQAYSTNSPVHGTLWNIRCTLLKPTAPPRRTTYRMPKARHIGTVVCAISPNPTKPTVIPRQPIQGAMFHTCA